MKFCQFVRNVHIVSFIPVSFLVQDSLAAAMQVAEERIANIRLLKSFSQESRECDTYNKKLQHVLQLAYKESWARGIFFGLVGTAS